MTKIQTTVAILLTLMLTACGGGEKNAEAANPAFDPDRWVGAWVESWNTYDLDQVDRLFLRDDRVSYFSSEKEGAIRGMEAVREHHRDFGFVPGGKQQPNRLWVEDLRASAFDGAAVVTGFWFFQRPDGSVQRGPVTFVYVARGEEYRLAHLHFANYPDGNPEEGESR